MQKENDVVSPKSDFIQCMDALHNSAGRITNGLHNVVKTIDTIAENNAETINTASSTSRDNDDITINALLEGIRKQISAIVEQGQQFETILDDCSTEVSDLSRQLKQTQEASRLDATTGISNRKDFARSLSAIVKNLSKYNEQVSVLLGDIDNFKHVNDDLGCDIGDQVLRMVASTFVSHLDKNAVVARWGGDEFAAALPGVDLKKARMAAEKIRKTVSAHSLKDKTTGQTISKITLSIGISSYKPDETSKSLIYNADQALFEAKCKGRNCTATKTATKTVTKQD